MAKTPDTIGKYKVISEVARGGMGAVYTAEHPTLDRTVIIKKLTIRGSAEIRERFRREASIMMDFRNEYIVDVFDHFREGSAYYIVQEYVDGMSLADLLRRERYLPERIALMIFRDCCRALKYAHDRGVVHRDIKPANILLSRGGEVKLVDFGIAHVEEEEDSTISRDGTVIGTPAYMAPEQFDEDGRADNRADIYSLGVMLYEMTTGERPFAGSFSPDAVSRIQKGRYRRPRMLNPALSRFTARIIRRSMSVKRSRRFRDVGLILSRLDRHFGARPVGEQRPEISAFIAGHWLPPKARSSVRGAVLVAAACAVLLIGGFAYYGIASGRANLLLAPERYGALRVTARVTGSPSATDRTLISASLFRDVDGTLNRVTAAGLSFHLSARQSTSETRVFETRWYYLATGQYRLRLASEGQLVWRGFYLGSRTRLLTEGRAGGRNLIVEIGREVNLPVEVSVRVTSAAEGQPVVGRTRIEINSAGNWVPFTGAITSSLRSGNSYRFRFQHPGYYPAEYTATIEPFQSNLRIAASLMPYPGALDLTSSGKGVRVTLDGSGTYLRWGRKPQSKRLPEIGSASTRLLLSPGDYTVTATSGSLSGTQRVHIFPLERVALRITQDQRSGTLRFEQGGPTDDPQLAKE